MSTIAAALALAACGASTKVASTAGGPSRAQGLAFAGCMRSHGLSGFPDPSAGHAMQFNLPAGVSPRSPAFLDAQRACRHLASSPGGGGGGVPAAQRAAGLKLAQCMRSHGVPNYPDPTYRNGRPIAQPLTVYGIDPNSPAVQRAQKTCGVN